MVSAYVDDINVFTKDLSYVDLLSDSLEFYEKVSPAKVKCDKSEALQVGQWVGRETPKLTRSLRWGRQGMKVLGV